MVKFHLLQLDNRYFSNEIQLSIASIWIVSWPMRTQIVFNIKTYSCKLVADIHDFNANMNDVLVVLVSFVLKNLFFPQAIRLLLALFFNTYFYMT